MNWSLVAKYVAGGVILASVYFLVLLGAVQPSEYMMLVGGILSGLGIYHTTMAQPPGAQPPAAAEKKAE